MVNTFVMLLLSLPIIGGSVYLFVLICRALKKYIESNK